MNTAPSDIERIEQLQTANDELTEANERLRTQLASAQQQLASLSALTTQLAGQQAGAALVSYGARHEKRWLSARSIRVVWLERGDSGSTLLKQPDNSGLFRVMVDELAISSHLEPANAERLRDEVAEALNKVLAPPARAGKP